MIRKQLAIVICLSLLVTAVSFAQSITFEVDIVPPVNTVAGLKESGRELAGHINLGERFSLSETEKPVILASSFAENTDLYYIGEDVLFKMLLDAWCQHRPVVLTPDAIWMVIAQGFSYYVNEHSESMRDLLVSHEGKKVLRIETDEDFLSGQGDWKNFIDLITEEIDKYSVGDVAGSLVADFSTTGADERIASEVTLMDAVKPYYEYTLVYLICGIPSITLTGTPEDWNKVLQKTLSLKRFGLGWWVDELEPILKEFVRASEGHPKISFWKDIVKKTRPQKVKGPTCSKRQPRYTRFDGWFLKFFPYDKDGLTPKKVTVVQTMLPETVCVPVKYEIRDLHGNLIDTCDLELVAGIVAVQQDTVTFTMTPKIGWFVRTARPMDPKESDDINPFDFVLIDAYPYRKWSEIPLAWSDFKAEPKDSDIFDMKLGFRQSPVGK